MPLFYITSPFYSPKISVSELMTISHILFPWIGSAVAEYLSRDLPYQLSPDDIYLTAGCCQAIDVMISVLAQPGSNILLPKPGFPLYESRTMFSNLEARHFNLIPDRGWEADLESVEALADENTVAMVIVNPSNPCGSVYSRDHLAKVSIYYSQTNIS